MIQRWKIYGNQAAAVTEPDGEYVASLNGNRSFDELVDGIQTFLLDDNMIDDGFGNSWSKTCPMCHMQTMQIVRPGKVQCSICG